MDPIEPVRTIINLVNTGKQAVTRLTWQRSGWRGVGSVTACGSGMTGRRVVHDCNKNKEKHDDAGT